jgi:acyl carrier protein
MGLETVEIVIEAEKTFGISLPDQGCSKVRTVGEFRDLIVEVLGRKKEGEGFFKEIFHELQITLPSILPQDANRLPIDVDTELPRLIPLFSRRQTWRRMAKKLDVKLPPLERSKWTNAAIAIASIVLALKYCWARGVLGVIFLMILLAILFFMMTLPLVVCCPENVRTVGDLAKYVLKSRYGNICKQEERFSKEEVWTLVQLIVADELGIKRSDVKPESRFVEDLGAG